MSKAVPFFSVSSEKGRRGTMEDAHDVQLNFAELPLDPTDMQEIVPDRLLLLLNQKSLRVRASTISDLSSARTSRSGELGSFNSKTYSNYCHLFSVFDGHGGSRAAEHCKNKLARNLRCTLDRMIKRHSLPIKELVRHKTVPTQVLLSEINLDDLDPGSDPENESEDTVVSPTQLEETDAGSEDSAPNEEQGLFSTMAYEVQDRMEYINDRRSLKTLVSTSLDTIGLNSEQLSSCFHDAFVMTDNQFDNIKGEDESGSTALMALISNQILCFAHCGDCRGVLFRDGKIIQVTREHSPESDDERERIERLGGRILTIRSDTARVMGVLNMTRSIGDFGLKPYIIPHPEVTILRRKELDDFIILASDGLWGVLNNQEACEIVVKCFQRIEDRGLSRHNASKIATNVLVRKAMDLGSPDNITVIVIDLRQCHYVGSM